MGGFVVVFVIGCCLCYFGCLGLASLFGLVCTFLVVLMLLCCYINSVDLLASWLCIGC